MIWLTRKEQRAVALVVTLLVVGWAVKTWRNTHDPGPSAVPVGGQY